MSWYRRDSSPNEYDWLGLQEPPHQFPVWMQVVAPQPPSLSQPHPSLLPLTPLSFPSYHSPPSHPSLLLFTPLSLFHNLTPLFFPSSLSPYSHASLLPLTALSFPSPLSPPPPHPSLLPLIPLSFPLSLSPSPHPSYLLLTPLSSYPSSRWAPSSVSHVANISRYIMYWSLYSSTCPALTSLREMTLIEDELRLLVNKILRYMYIHV